ncbi:MAG: hypothetical protein A3G49_04195 [Candidatus Sungbacteria bacterium RIFCSPLOWO2_12_FULL_41_11]|uniref:Uncharacterized protein n=1 Tax=Candidatus Sungbacteria bacterium RIFCSPLOWO2_12_FULL_41_11 TaxID=1802286 RepID=A0A1G2LVP2_9BACT|nr:MAG: hypothetical protein UV01_C0010G0028 [Parcubacteria group bacterium GW2011_GWA2_42_14]OGZ99336.1 MAG: hypothetical protein A3D41_02660 [Candidatus Sungbacteria bacterium RIFCSPHIGHO2_02_FULL_41_12b]OHA14861.1 MAG: hypothetical protein A3G49_04195 [Candidatus Sungbacteria bacterium RIFCSPLOWO2_12_FULL_41_11]
MTTITIPKKLINGDNFILVEKEDFERLNKENTELRLAVKAILAGEIALRNGKTRSFKQFLKSRHG